MLNNVSENYLQSLQILKGSVSLSAQNCIKFRNNRVLGGHCCAKFLLRDLAELIDRMFCYSQRETLMKRVPVMMTPIGMKEFNTEAWTVVWNSNTGIDSIVTTITPISCSVVGLVEGKQYFDARPLLCDAVATICLAACVTVLLTIGGISFNRYFHICHPDIYPRFDTFTAMYPFTNYSSIDHLLCLPPFFQI